MSGKLRKVGPNMRSFLARMFFSFLLCLIIAAPAYSQTFYRDSEYGVAVSLTPDWKLSPPMRWGDQQTTYELREVGTKQKAFLYFQILHIPQVMPAKAMDKRLMRGVEHKVDQRIAEGYQGYHLRPDSTVLHAVNGRSALTWVAEYTEKGRSMVEYLTRVRSENTNALIFARMPAEQLDDFKSRIDPVIETLQIP